MLKSKALKQIEKKLEDDISKEIELVKSEIFFILDKDLDLYFLREFAKYYPRKLLKEKSEILLDTLLNYLMKEVLEDVKNMELNHQYEFFKENLREKIKSITIFENGGFKPPLLKIKEDEGILDKTLTAAPGIAVSAGGIIATVAIPETLPLKAIPAVSTLIGPVYIIKKLREKNKRLKNVWKKQISAYLKNIKYDLKKWLFEAENKFLKDLENFYKKINALHIDNRIKEQGIYYDKQNTF